MVTETTDIRVAARARSTDGASPSRAVPSAPSIRQQHIEQPSIDVVATVAGMQVSHTMLLVVDTDPRWSRTRRDRAKLPGGREPDSQGRDRRAGTVTT